MSFNGGFQESIFFEFLENNSIESNILVLLLFRAFISK